MSVLIACRGTGAPDGVVLRPILKLRKPRSHVAMVAAVGGVPDQWSAVSPADGRAWDDWVDDAAVHPDRAEAFVALVGAVAEQSSELVIWYASFVEALPVVDSPAVFRTELARLVRAGEQEPSLRMVVSE